MRGNILSILVLCGLAPALSGCVFIVLGYLASVPGPRTSIDVVWAEDPNICAGTIEGRPSFTDFVGLESHHVSRASGLSFTERRYEVWKVPTDDASFTDLGGLGRAVFDFDNDGALDLVYTLPDRVIVGPATPAARDAFESRHIPEEALPAAGFQVYHRQDWLSQMTQATRVDLQRADGVTYLLATLPPVPFDPHRPSAPKYTPLWNGEAPTDNTAWTADLYRLGAKGAIRKVCTFLAQRTAYAIGGF